MKKTFVILGILGISLSSHAEAKMKCYASIMGGGDNSLSAVELIEIEPGQYEYQTSEKLGSYLFTADIGELRILKRRLNAKRDEDQFDYIASTQVRGWKYPELSVAGTSADNQVITARVECYNR